MIGLGAEVMATRISRLFEAFEATAAKATAAARARAITSASNPIMNPQRPEREPRSRPAPRAPRPPPACAAAVSPFFAIFISIAPLLAHHASPRVARVARGRSRLDRAFYCGTGAARRIAIAIALRKSDRHRT